MTSRAARLEWEKLAGTQLCFLQMQTDLCKHVRRFLRMHIWVGTRIHCFVSGQQGSEPTGTQRTLPSISLQYKGPGHPGEGA